ncbi:19481_t:CDS:1 [Dentiscutata erythropus]|uniref:19481_t:CDS:1 n=1 Tax=Dentiscutata erythropus TaxID=1348616 RepID=A0A9N8ZMG0_9GLOM|nr:19481_t:CDS:1 [Dentiscutata erythropus]
MVRSLDILSIKSIILWFTAVFLLWIIFSSCNFDEFKYKQYFKYFTTLDLRDPLATIKLGDNGISSITSPARISLDSSFLKPYKKRSLKNSNLNDNRLKGPGIDMVQQQAASESLEHEIHKHYEEESEDWWEVYRSYEYETADSLGDMFLVQVEEAQVIHKQHALLDDLQHADEITQDTASQDVFSAGGTNKLEQSNVNANASSVAVAEAQQHQQEDLMDVKQYQKIHVLQVSAAGLMINEYEEERLADYQYQLEVDIFNQWEYQSEQESQQADNFAVE